MAPGEAAHPEARDARTERSLVVDALRTVPWGLSALLLSAFVASPYLPMVDLPQHAAQIGVWLRMSDASFRGASFFTVNLATPYLTAYVAARALAAWIGVVPALKVVVWASAVLYLFAFSRLVKALGHSRFIALFGLPLGLGYPFYFGMISFAAAMPFVLLSIEAALRYRREPTARRALLLGALLCATLVAHGFAAGIALMMVSPLLLRGEGRLVVRIAPLAAPVLLWAVWILPAGSIRAIGATYWDPRLLEVFRAPALWFAASAADHLAVVFGYALLLLVVLGVGRPVRRLEQWAPLALLLAGFCCFPAMLSGFGPLHPRFAAFFVPGLLLAFEPRKDERAAKLVMPALALSACWFGVLVARLYAFTLETRPVRDFIAAMPDGLSVRPIIFERESRAFPGLPALLHLSAYYMVEKGGLQAYSFAMYPTSVIRYAPSFVPGMGGGAEWHPEAFSPEHEVGKYDCFLVHSTAEPGAIFGAKVGDLNLDFHEGGFWAYRPWRVADADEAESPWRTR